MSYLLKSFLAIFILIFMFFSSGVVLAEDATSSPKTTFEAFWPLSAGKTIDDPLYFLKIWKENLRGMLIFGNPQKADYAVYLGTKRVLEGDKLLKEGKTNLALKTLKSADLEFSSAYSHVKAAASKGKVSREEIRKDRLLNLKTLIDQLRPISPEEVRPELDGVKDRVDSILRDFLP